jgi:hypothetical protein
VKAKITGYQRRDSGVLSVFTPKATNFDESNHVFGPFGSMRRQKQFFFFFFSFLNIRTRE